MSATEFSSRDRFAEHLQAIARELLNRKGIGQNVNLDAPLSEDGLGLNPVGQLELLHAIEQQCNVQIPEVYWGTRPIENLNHLLDILGL